MKTLSFEQIIILHIAALKMGGGSEGVRDAGRLEAAVATQTQEVFGEELYRDVFSKSAALARGIIGDHPFADGNKRTAMLCALTFLAINGVELTATNQELEDFAVKIATDRLSIEEIAEWLRDNSTS